MGLEVAVSFRITRYPEVGLPKPTSLTNTLELLDHGIRPMYESPTISPESGTFR
jgi:hypothetical protein